MDLLPYFKSILDQDTASIVVCDLEHTIIYMNPAAGIRMAKYGGMALLGKNLLACHNPASVESIHRVVSWFQESPDHNMVYTAHNAKENRDLYMVALRDDSSKLIGYYEKHEYRNPETHTFYDFQSFSDRF